ncbi:MAG: sugar ABC transporter permease [Pseudobutyrivibrio sp.]|nr:sugar ABC transporter permease [Pseudobutyrivibrio sp.]
MKKHSGISRAKWGYICILPFFLTYIIFSLIPLLDTIRYSFFEYYRSGLRIVGPNFVGFDNYINVMGKDFFTYMGNTFTLWIIGFVPQIVIALLLASWFVDMRLKIHGEQFFKVVIYLPNLIMASAFAMLFFTLFSTSGPVNNILVGLGLAAKPIDFMGTALGTRLLIALMNFLMWFGNTTIMLMAAIMGISPDIFEAASIDGCTPRQSFFHITLPLIRPILTYTLITSLIGGLQMFDVPQILTNGQGNPNRSSYTLIMWLNNLLRAPDYGRAGALSVYLFIVSGILCLIVYRMVNGNVDDIKAEARARKKRLKRNKEK